MESSWLVQRLRKPRGINPFSFGGGLKNGGLSDEAMDLIQGLFTFDYMGAAEFEFGAVPKALGHIAELANENNLSHFVLTVRQGEVEPDFRDKTEADEPRSIYVLCASGDENEVAARIRSWAASRYNGDLKETTHIAGTLRPSSEWDGECVGWLELDNGFFFFADKTMFEGTAALFGVKVES